jgi:hypothetical protein
MTATDLFNVTFAPAPTHTMFVIEAISPSIAASFSPSQPGGLVAFQMQG